MINIYVLLALLCLTLTIAVADRTNLPRSAVQTGSTDIIPILQCIDKNNKAYFSYQNNVGDVVNLATSNFNRLTPLGIAPITTFVNGSGPAFPYSAEVSLAGYENSTFNWDLLNYFLTFNITPELACPTTFNITMNFKYEIEGATGFLAQVTILNTFAQVAGISVSRLTVIGWTDTGPTAKRATMQLSTADLTLEIQLTDGNSTNSNATDPTAAEVVNQFVTNQKTEEFNQQLQSQFSPKYSNLTEFTPKSDPTPSVQGQLKPNVPSVEPVADNEPISVPSSVPVSSPKPKTTLSSASTYSLNTFVIFAASLIAICFLELF